MAQRKTTQRYQTPSGYRYTRNKYLELQRAVQNYNRRLQRIQKNVGPLLEDALPGKLSFVTVRDRVASTKDVNEIIYRLNMYRGEGFNFVPNPYGEGFITQAQLDIAEREAAQENRRRKRALELATRGAEAEGRLPTDMTSALRPVSPGIYTTSQDDPIASILYGRRIGEQTAQWQARYLAALDEALNSVQLLKYSDDKQNEIVNRILRIRGMVESLSPSQYYYAQLVFPQLQITILTNIPLFLEGVQEVEELWEAFYRSL